MKRKSVLFSNNKQFNCFSDLRKEMAVGNCFIILHPLVCRRYDAYLPFYSLVKPFLLNCDPGLCAHVTSLLGTVMQDCNHSSTDL